MDEVTVTEEPHHVYWTPEECGCQARRMKWLIEDGGYGQRHGCPICDGGLKICKVCGTENGISKPCIVPGGS